MKTILKLNETIKLKNKTYKVIGIDRYVLKNLIEKTRKWVSYTLVDAKNNKTWISFGQSDKYFIQWSTITEKEFKNYYPYPLNFELTGIANVSFLGNPGYSTPNVELIWFNIKKTDADYLIVERFLKQTKSKVEAQTPYYMVGKLLKHRKL